jgi:FkbM family methyltransferase
MKYRIKNFIKNRPRLYDFVNQWKPINNELERWINNYSKVKKNVHFIQVGASDGLRWDPYRKFIVRDGWKGILVEPIPPVFEMLKENYSYVQNHLDFVNAIITNKNYSTFPIWTFSSSFLSNFDLESKMYYLRKSSVNKSNLKKFIKKHEAIEDKIRKYYIPCLTIDSLIKIYWRYNMIDLLAIDAEGHDEEIIKSIDFNNIQPEVIIFETHYISNNIKDIISLLERNGYSIKDFNGDVVSWKSK